MNRTSPSLALVFCLAASTAFAQEHDDEHMFTGGDITIEHPWVRAAAAGADTLMFFESENEGETDTLLSATADVAASIEIVGLSIVGDRVEMIPIGPIEIPAGTFEFDPGGLALALHGLSEALTVESEIEVTLIFANAGEIEIHVLVEPSDAMFHSHNH